MSSDIIRELLTVILTVLGTIMLTRYRVDQIEKKNDDFTLKIDQIKDRIHALEIRDAERRGKEQK